MACSYLLRSFRPIYIGFSKLKNRKTKQAEGQDEGEEEKNPTVLYSLVSLVEWVSAGIVMYVILILFGIDIEFQKFFRCVCNCCFSWRC